MVIITNMGDPSVGQKEGLHMVTVRHHKGERLSDVDRKSQETATKAKILLDLALEDWKQWETIPEITIFSSGDSSDSVEGRIIADNLAIRGKSAKLEVVSKGKQVKVGFDNLPTEFRPAISDKDMNESLSYKEPLSQYIITVDGTASCFQKTAQDGGVYARRFIELLSEKVKVGGYVLWPIDAYSLPDGDFKMIKPGIYQRIAN